MVRIQHVATCDLCGHNNGESQRQVPRIRVHVDWNQEFNGVLGNIVTERVRKPQRLPPDFGRHLAGRLTVLGHVLVEKPGKPPAAIPFVPTVGIRQGETMPVGRDDGVCLVGKVATDEVNGR